jgi:hypothetical protein
MKSSEHLQVLKNAIAATKESGADNVTITNLEAFSERLSDIAGETPDDVAAGEAGIEKYKADLSVWIAGRQHSRAYSLEMLRSIIAVGQTALTISLLINGGAAVALLAFVGGVCSRGANDILLRSLAFALLLYVTGVLAAAVATGATYFSQAGYAGEFGKGSRVVGRVGHALAILGVISAYILFGFGSWHTFSSLTGG